MTSSSHTTPSNRLRLAKRAHQFFVRGQQMWRKESNGHHQLVLFNPDRLRILQQTHDELGYRGFYNTRRTIADRFWWPSLDRQP